MRQGSGASLEEADLLEVLDHHRLQRRRKPDPVYCGPVGSTLNLGGRADRRIQ